MEEAARSSCRPVAAADTGAGDQKGAADTGAGAQAEAAAGMCRRLATTLQSRAPLRALAAVAGSLNKREAVRSPAEQGAGTGVGPAGTRSSCRPMGCLPRWMC